MRITYFHYEWDLKGSTGAATQIAETAAGLERLGHVVEVVPRHARPQDGAEKQVGTGTDRRASAVTHRWLWEAANFGRSVTGIRTEERILRQQRPDIVLTLHALRFSSVIAARRAGLPVVLQVNASVPHEIRRYRPELHILPGISDWIELKTVASADRIVVVSSVLRDCFVKRGLPAERIGVVPNGADAAKFRPEAAAPEICARFAGRTLVGFAGSFGPFHGVALLKRAIAAAAARFPEAHFVLVGGGPGAEELQGYCRRCGWAKQVTFTGWMPRERVPGVLAAMDVLLAPYEAEERFYFSPLKLFEYMACGRAVLASRLGQIAEIIEDGRNGLLCDPQSPDDLMQKLFELLSNPALRSRLGAEARRTIQRQFTWDHNARLMNESLDQACREHSRRLSAGLHAAPDTAAHYWNFRK